MDQEDASSCVISSPCNPRTNINVDTSGSDNIHNQTIRTGKRPRHHNDSTAKVPKYKGVVPQQNGHWGAQIYANQSRHWLGTFKSEKEAAMAYDSAAIKLRSGDSRRNLPWTALTTQEYNFQIPFSEEEVLNMIRDGSYQPKFQQFLRLQCGKGLILPGIIQNMVHRDGNFTCMQLFQKELTPSDVGKLNRLVIPKRFAVKYFPYVPEDNVGGGIAETELVFHDRLMKPWKFRYSFWTSSQSYVFTKGWSGFVKEKNLKEKDIVTFHKCMSRLGQHFSIIDVTYSSGQVNGVNPFQERAKEFQSELGLGQKVKNHLRDSEKGCRSKEYSNNNVNGCTSFKLFGVSIEEGNCSTNFPS